MVQSCRSPHHPTSTYPPPRESKTNKGQRQRRFQTVDNSNTHWFRWKGKYTGSGKPGTSAHHANLTLVEDSFYYDEDMSESANARSADNDPVDPRSEDGEEALDNDDDEENDTFSSYVALDDATVFEAAELDAVALLADTWGDNLDPKVSAQLVQASAQAYLSFGKDKGKGEGKKQRKGQKADTLFDRRICRWKTVGDE